MFDERLKDLIVTNVIAMPGGFQVEGRTIEGKTAWIMLHILNKPTLEFSELRWDKES